MRDEAAMFKSIHAQDDKEESLKEAWCGGWEADEDKAQENVWGGGKRGWKNVLQHQSFLLLTLTVVSRFMHCPYKLTVIFSRNSII